MKKVLISNRKDIGLLITEILNTYHENGCVKVFFETHHKPTGLFTKFSGFEVGDEYFEFDEFIITLFRKLGCTITFEEGDDIFWWANKACESVILWLKHDNNVVRAIIK